MRTLVRGFGWLSVAAGAVVGLYLVYTLLFTNLLTDRAQDDLLDQWGAQVSAVDAEAPPQAPAPAEEAPGTQSGENAVVAAGPPPDGAVALLSFARPGNDAPIVADEPYVVVEGTDAAQLRLGPGHYPDTAQPGAAGNFAVAGHRVTYGAPFFHLDELVAGDQVLVTDRAGTRFTYQVVEQRIVAPTEVSILTPDPLGSGRPTLTLTTCHPRHSNRQRLIVFAELVA